MRNYLLCFIALIFLGISANPASAQTEAAPAPAAAGTSPEAAAPADPALSALLDVLKNDAARQKLITELERMIAPDDQTPAGDASATTSAATATETDQAATTATDDAAAPATDQAASPPTDEPLWSQQIADITTGLAGQVYTGLGAFWRDLSGMRFVVETMTPEKRARVESGALSLAATMVATFALQWLLWRFGRRYLLVPQRDETAGAPLVMKLRNALVRALTVVIAFLLGYLVSIGVNGTNELISEQSLFLNAFLIAGLTTVVIGMFLRLGYSQFAFLDIGDSVRNALYSRIVVLVYILVYGIVALVPIASYWANFASGRALRIVVMSIAAIWALEIIRHFAGLGEAREKVDEESIAAASDAAHDDAATEEPNLALVFWGMLWPVIATLYVLASWGIAVAQPGLMASLIGGATLQTVIVIVLTLATLRGLSYLSGNGMPLPRSLQRALPPLRERVQNFVPAVTRALSVLVLIIAGFFILDAWNLINGFEILTRPEVADFFARFGVAIIVLIFALIFWAVVSSYIDFKLSLNLPGRNVNARTRTLLTLFRNAFTVLIITFAVMTALSQLGIDIAPLLAGAGIAGIAVGFGAQKMVQDVITGVFIQVENAINVGDVVTVAGVTGVVERLTIRSVSLRDLQGVYHIVPFSAVDTVSNFMRRFAFHVAEIGVAYKEDIPSVKAAMQEAFDRLKQTEHGKDMIGDFEMHGLTELADSSMVMRGRIKTKPGEQWAVGRAYTEFVKQVFDERGIEIPYPHRTMIYQAEVPPPYDGVPEAPTKSETASKPKRSRRAKPASIPGESDVD